MRKLLCFLALAVLLQSCGSDTSNSSGNSDNPPEKSQNKNSYTFAAKVDPSTLVTAGYFGAANLPESSYVINTSSDLAAFNQMISLPTPLVFDDLDTYSYFFVKEVSCPISAKYVGDSADATSLTLKFDIYNMGNVSCPAIAGTFFDIYKAKKIN